MRSFRSSVAGPAERGLEFGAAHPREVAATIAAYQGLFDRAAGTSVDLARWGAPAREQIALVSPDLAVEVDGIARGADVDPLAVAAINARTEILAALGAVATKECSAVVQLHDPEPPIAVQTWDWYAALAHLWLVWEIPHPTGARTTTLTEFGIVGKIGVSSRGLGLLFNLLHHAADGDGIGAPVHVLARAVLDDCANLDQALTRVAAARPSASSSLTLVARRGGESDAVSVELNPHRVGFVLPDDDGLLVHTNHFVSHPAAESDTTIVTAPDTLLRYAALRRRLARRRANSSADLVTALHSHLLAAGATCAHPDPDLPLDEQFQTLATITLDVERGRLHAHTGGPCTHPSSGA